MVLGEFVKLKEDHLVRFIKKFFRKMNYVVDLGSEVEQIQFDSNRGLLRLTLLLLREVVEK